MDKPSTKRAKNLIEAYKYRWELHARDKQVLPNGDWTTWLIKAGRGFGKTRTGAETVRYWKDTNPIIILAGATASDVRDIMIEGESGMLNISPKWDKPIYQSSKSQLVWNNGARALLRSADEPDRFRGLQCYKAWCDELAAWRYPESWDQLRFGLRLGDQPQCIVTTTPRPTKLIKELIKDQTTLVTNGTSYENKENLSNVFFDQIIKKYEGTRMGRQELNAEVLDDVEGALWKMSMIDNNRVSKTPDLIKIVVAIDPSVTSNKDSDETGIVAVGKGTDGHFYILSDESGIYTPNQWATKSIKEYDRLMASAVIGEANNGGDMIEAVLRNLDNRITYKKVHASRGKVTRAEPVVGLYEQNKVHHVGCLSKLEQQMTEWDAGGGDKSPDRVDALVWGVSELMDNGDKFFVG